MFEQELAIYKRIQESPIITIWGHGLPDGDCYGCQIGLREILRANFPEKKVYAIGSGLPILFKRLAPMDEVSEDVIKESLAILVDVSCLRRVEDQRVLLAKSFLKFDHHMPNREEPFEDLQIVDAKRVSCAEIIAEWAFSRKLTINRLAAEALYTGIATDSGRFGFFGTTVKTFQIATKLFECGVVPDTLSSIVFAEDPKIVRFRSFLIEQSKIEGRVAYCILNPEDYLPRGLSFEEASSLVSVLASFRTDYYVLFCADSQDEVRVELRSHAPYAVQPVAMRFGGGGHLYAAGCSIRRYENEAYDAIIKALNENEPSEE